MPSQHATTVWTGSKARGSSVRRLASLAVIVVFTSVALAVEERPVLTEFGATQTSASAWTFDGMIEDTNPTAWTVKLSGVIPDRQVPVDPDGTFSDTVFVEPGTSGIVTAKAYHQNGIFVSNLRECYIDTN